MDNMQMKLECGLYNTQKEIEITEFVASVIDGYKGVFNKRFTTWLDKQLADKFGTKEYYNEYTKVTEYWNNVRASLSNPYKNDYPEFSLYWHGKQINRGYNNEPAEIRETSNESTRVYTATGTDKIKAQMLDIAAARKNSIEKMLDTRKHIKQLQANKLKLEKLVSEHNDKVSYILSDELRVK